LRKHLLMRLATGLSKNLGIIAGITGLIFWCVPASAESQSEPISGSVCLGPHLGKVREKNEFQRLYLRIGDSGEIHFNPSQNARIVANNLHPHKTYRVTVYFDSKPVNSWPLRLDTLKSNMVIIWRSAGAWRMEPTDKCEWRW
jgi:hypothetical protein